MKNTISVFAAAVLFASCGKDKKEENYTPEAVQEGTTTPALSAQAQLGKEIFEGKGNCYSCHRAEEKSIGPSIKEIARIYKEKNADIKAFLLEKSEPIVDPSQYATMRTNFYITKTFSEEELKAVEAYIYSN